MVKFLLRFLVIVVILFSNLLHPYETVFAQKSPTHPYYFDQIKKDAVRKATTSGQTKSVLGKNDSRKPTPTLYIYPTPTLYVFQQKQNAPQAKNVYTAKNVHLSKETKNILSVIPSIRNSPTIKAQEIFSGESIIIRQINEYRASLGLPAVKENPATCQFAKLRADEIFTAFNHDGFSQRINSKQLPYSTWSNVVENIAMNTNVNDVFSLWKNSPPHAENMKANTSFVCVQNTSSYFAYEGMSP